MTDYEGDFDRLTRDIAEARTEDIEQATLQAYRWYSLASLGGRLSDFAEAERVLSETIERFGPREDLCLLKANLDFRFHRLPEVRADLESIIKDHPNFSEAHVALAGIYYRLKQKAEGDRERAIVKRLQDEAQARQPGVIAR